VMEYILRVEVETEQRNEMELKYQTG